MTPELFAAAESLEISPARGRLRATLARFVADEAGAVSTLEYLVVVAISGVLTAEFLFSSVTPGVVDEWRCRREYIYDGRCSRAGSVSPTHAPAAPR